MKTKYINLIDQTFDFPQEEFTLKNGTLHYYDVDLQELINTYGTPLKFTYLPAVSNQVKLAVDLFGNAMKKVNYPGKYHFCYVTKSSHFKPVIETTLRNGAQHRQLKEEDAFLIHFQLWKASFHGLAAAPSA